MSQLGTLKKLRITMKKHPKSLTKLEAPLVDRVLSMSEGEIEKEIFRGPVKEIAPLAPNNVNTMACGALACLESLGFQGTEALLIADSRLDAHIVEIYLEGPNGFNVNIVRTNPAPPGAITGNATFQSFVSSLRIAANNVSVRGGQVIFC
eukprot:PhF_6_TR33820/c0_g1_i2/m.49599/K06989/nadX; aspartate dehydrogenase